MWIRKILIEQLKNVLILQIDHLLSLVISHVLIARHNGYCQLVDSFSGSFDTSDLWLQKSCQSGSRACFRSHTKSRTFTKAPSSCF